MVRSNSRTLPSHRDLVKSVSKKLKYYFELKRQEDGFDLSGPECPRPDYPNLKTRPMLLYEGLHDRSVKHFYSDDLIKQQITHLKTEEADGDDVKKIKHLVKSTMDKTTYVPQWSGSGNYMSSKSYVKNSEKYVTGEWNLKQRSSRRRGYGNPEPTLKRAFKDPPGAKARFRRSCPLGWIDNRECNRLVNDACKILSSSHYNERKSSASSRRTSTLSDSVSRRTRSQSPYSSSSDTTLINSREQSIKDTERTTPNRPHGPTPPRSAQSHRTSLGSASRLTDRPQSARHVITYSDAKKDVVKKYERSKTEDNLKKGKIYYDVDGRKKPVPHKLREHESYLSDDKGGDREQRSTDDNVSDWLRDQMTRQDVNEKKMPYNNSIKQGEVSEPDTARSEDLSQREGQRPKTSSKYKSSRSDSRSHVTLSEGTYEQVNSQGELVEERGCQTGWELIVNYDKTEHILYDLAVEPTDYKMTVRTGTCVGASTKAEVHIILYGTRGRSPEIILKNCINHKIPFQQGADDVFVITASYVGTIEKIKIGHDEDSGIGDGWFLDSVSVEDPVLAEVFEFVCNKWLSVRADDKMTKRLLLVSANRKIQQKGEDDETEDESEITRSKSPKEAIADDKSSVSHSRSSRSSTHNSTSHLNNESAGKGQGSRTNSIGVDSESSSYESVESTRVRNVQEHHISVVKRPAKGRQTPEGIEDFESDIARHSNKKSVSSRSDDSSADDTECQTAVFEERSVFSDRPSIDEDLLAKERMEAFKAGQRAQMESSRLNLIVEKESSQAAVNELLRGPTIHQSARSGDIRRVKQLLDHNPDLKDSMDEKGNSPLHLSVECGHLDIVKLLVAQGADLQAKDQAGYEPAHMAALRGHVSCLMALVAMGAPIDSRSDDSKTPLHLAAMSGNMETCKWLVANRASFAAEDDFGRTAFELAENNNHMEVAKFLRECLNDLKSRRTSLGYLLHPEADDGKMGAFSGSWRDDQKEKPVMLHRGAESEEDDESFFDLRKDPPELEEKRKAYDDMKKQENENVSFLDIIRAEVDREA